MKITLVLYLVGCVVAELSGRRKRPFFSCFLWPVHALRSACNYLHTVWALIARDDNGGHV